MLSRTQSPDADLSFRLASCANEGRAKSSGVLGSADGANMNVRLSHYWLPWATLLAIVTGLVLLAGALPSWQPNTSGPSTDVVGGTGWPRTLVESYPDGTRTRSIVLNGPPQRIVSVTLATDEILLDLLGPERILALSYLAAEEGSLIADRIGNVQHFVGTDVESIIALKPDLCFLASYNREEVRSLLIDSGVPVYVFRSFDGVEDVRRNIRTIGRAVGAEQQAEQLIGTMDRKIESVARRLPPRDKWPSALVYGQSGWVAGTGTTQTDLFAAAGLRNAAADAGIAGFAQVSEEEVLALAPDYLVVVQQSVRMAQHEEWLLNNPALAPLPAVRDKRFLTLPGPLLTTASHRIADAVFELASQAYPNRFSDAQQ